MRKKKIICGLLSGVMCMGMLFSTPASVHAHEASAHAGCEHNWPPQIVEIDNGYEKDASGHWKLYSTIARCRDCGETLQVISQRTGEKSDHKFVLGGCSICNYMP